MTVQPKPFALRARQTRRERANVFIAALAILAGIRFRGPAMIRRPLLVLLLLGVAAALAGCGNKGDLVRPTPQGQALAA